MLPTFRILDKQEILTILPLIQKINTKTPTSILENRFLEMIELPHYECAAMYIDNKLVGVTGLWYTLRHYVGNSVEPDHVIIDEAYRNQGLGKLFFEWIYKYTKNKGCEAMELNTYVENRKSHKFYYNEGFEIFGFHFVKILRESQQFY